MATKNNWVCFRNSVNQKEAYIELGEDNLIVNGVFITPENGVTIRYCGFETQSQIQEIEIVGYKKPTIKLL